MYHDHRNRRRVFRQNLGEMISQVQYRKDSVVINKDGRAVAALIFLGRVVLAREQRAQAREQRLHVRGEQARLQTREQVLRGEPRVDRR